jgi:hypothetical protein
MRSVPAGCQAGSLNGAYRQWCAWFFNRATAVDRSQCQCAVVLANKTEKHAILAPDWRHNACQFAESPGLGGLDTRCIQVDDEESRGRRGGAHAPNRSKRPPAFGMAPGTGLTNASWLVGRSPLVGVQATGAVVGRR